MNLVDKARFHFQRILLKIFELCLVITFQFLNIFLAHLLVPFSEDPIVSWNTWNTNGAQRRRGVDMVTRYKISGFFEVFIAKIMNCRISWRWCLVLSLKNKFLQKNDISQFQDKKNVCLSVIKLLAKKTSLKCHSVLVKKLSRHLGRFNYSSDSTIINK